MKKVTIIDYGLGNLLSVVRAFEQDGADITVANTAADVQQAERLVVPGVGSFEDGIKGLQSNHFWDPILAFASSGRPFLGICVGMQMMLDVGEEFGEHKGLGLIPGRVTAIPKIGSNNSPHKIPHIGWNELTNRDRNWHNPFLNNVKPGSAVYFVHSFMAKPEDPTHRLADCHYDGIAVSAIIHRDNLYGCQFHPEKSGKIGLQMIHNFMNL